jgi:hypothetical protein
MVGIDNRIFNGDEDMTNVLNQKIDFDYANSRLDKERVKGYEFIKEAIK